MGEFQFGFKEAMGTREALFCVNVLVQNCRDVHKDIFPCFIDYEKAFDTVQRDSKEIRCIRNLYWQQTAEIKVNNSVTNPIPINKDVRQGCALSPLLFIVYSERIFQEALSNVSAGIKVNGIRHFWLTL